MEFKCNQCEFASSTKSDFRQHVVSAHAGLFVCEKCEYVAVKSYELRIHMNAVHEDVKTFRFGGEFLQLYKLVQGILNMYLIIFWDQWDICLITKADRKSQVRESLGFFQLYKNPNIA